MVSNNQMEPLLTVREVARLLYIHPNTVRRWSDQGIIKAYHITPRGDRRFRREDIYRLLAELNTNRGNSKNIDPARR
jgi:excisionase family DNA binding protein